MVYCAEYSIWSVMWEKVYRYEIADVDEFKTRLIDEWAQSIVDAAISQQRRRLISAFVRVRRAHFVHKFWQFWIELLYKLIILLNKPYFGLLLCNNLKHLGLTRSVKILKYYGIPDRFINIFKALYILQLLCQDRKWVYRVLWDRLRGSTRLHPYSFHHSSSS